MTSESAYENTVMVPKEISLKPEEEYDFWYEAHFFYNAYVNAAEAIRQEASRAFLQGKDEVAVILRREAAALDERGRIEADEWQRHHQAK